MPIDRSIAFKGLRRCVRKRLGNEAGGTRTRNHRIDSRLVDEPVGDANYGSIKQLADHDDSDDEPRAAESAAVDPWEAWMAGCPGNLRAK